MLEGQVAECARSSSLGESGEARDSGGLQVYLALQGSVVEGPEGPRGLPCSFRRAPDWPSNNAVSLAKERGAQHGIGDFEICVTIQP